MARIPYLIPFSVEKAENTEELKTTQAFSLKKQTPTTALQVQRRLNAIKKMDGWMDGRTDGWMHCMHGWILF